MFQTTSSTTTNQDGRHQKEDEVDQGRDRPALRHHRQVRERHQGGGHHLQGGEDQPLEN